MSEYEHLINNYLCKNILILNNGFNYLTQNELNYIFHNLKPFNNKAPDMYSVTQDKLILLEHFEFDASYSNRKGMSGKREEKALEARLKNNKTTNEWILDKANYDISFESWQKNFEKAFQNHYKKIDTYIKNVRNNENDFQKEIVMGFIAENQYPPLVDYNKKFYGELPYWYTKQFIEFFERHERINFILFIGFLSGRPQVVYLDHESIKSINNPQNLKSDILALSKLNMNEVSMYSRFE